MNIQKGAGQCRNPRDTDTGNNSVSKLYNGDSV